MALKDDLAEQVDLYVKSSWGEIPVGRVVPTAESLTFGNTGIYIDACVLYADIHKSTRMVESLTDTRAAEYYKAFLHCAAKILKENNGTIVAYDGDRAMAIFIGTGKCDAAIKAAFELHWVVRNIINPKFNAFYSTPYRLQHTVGIDVGRLLASKTGVRVDSDIVWVGNAANHASKLNSFEGLDPDYPTRITVPVWNEASYFSCYNSEATPYWEQPEQTGSITYRRSHYMQTL